MSASPVISGTSTTAPLVDVTRVSTSATGAQAAFVGYSITIPSPTGIAFPPPPQVFWVSGKPASQWATLSPDGNLIAFSIQATNLESVDSGNHASDLAPFPAFHDLYVKNLATGNVTRITKGSSTPVVGLAFSPDGTKLAFSAPAKSVIPNETSSIVQVFVKDLVTGSVTLVSASSTGVAGEQGSSAAAFSPDGNFIAFTSGANNLTPDDFPNTSNTGDNDVFVKNLSTGAITLVSTNAAGVKGNGGSFQHDLNGGFAWTPDGNSIAFLSNATNLGYPGGPWHFYLKNLVTGAVTLLNVDSQGNPLPHLWGGKLSPDGKTAIVVSGNGTAHLYVGNTGGALQDIGPGWYPSFSADGGKIAYIETISVGADYRNDVYVLDIATGSKTRISGLVSGAKGNGSDGFDGIWTAIPLFFPDGSKIAYVSTSSDLVPSDTNNASDIFVASLGYKTGGAAVSIAAGLTLSDVDSASLTGATIAITGNALSGDMLNFVNQNGISGSFNPATQTLTLAGVATISQYQAALRSVTFSSTNIHASSNGHTNRTVTWTINDGTNISAPVTTVFNVVRAGTFARDLNGDETGDILLQNSSGQEAVCFMNGATVMSGSGNVFVNPGIDWKLAGSGDFNRDGRSDMLWQNSNGQIAIWFMNGTSLLDGSGPVYVNPGASWKVAGAGDFDGNGISDILLQNTNGQAAIWFMRGNVVETYSSALPVNPGSDWRIAGTGDFNGDGKSDVVLQNTNGQAAIWFMDKTQVLAGSGNAGVNPGNDWKIVGAGEFNGDGKTDILLQNTNGQAAVWFMDGATVLACSGKANVNPGSDWKITGTGDYNGDGMSDVLLQNTTGQVAVWLMNGTGLLPGSGIAGVNPGASWHVVAGTGA